MKQYSLVVILHICLLAILSVGVYVLYCADLWFSMLITFLFLLGTGIHLYYIQMKQLQMMRRLTDSLRYNDMTQAFRPPYKNKLMTEMAVELSETLQAFRARLLEEEIKHQYYESLLNKVDTAVLVTDMSGRIEWLNRAATAQLGQDPQLPAELLSLPSGETQVIRIHRNGTTLEMAVAATLFVARGMERRSLVAGAIARGELVQLTAVTVPYPWHYWLTVSPQAENRPEVARFIAWLEEEIALWRQQISA